MLVPCRLGYEYLYFGTGKERKLGIFVLLCTRNAAGCRSVVRDIVANFELQPPPPVKLGQAGGARCGGPRCGCCCVSICNFVLVKQVN